MTTVFRHTPDDDDETSRDRTVERPTDLKFVGPSTAAVVEASDFSARDVADKRVSYRMLVEAGVNPGVAAKIRRHHSLSWSFESGDDLSRRSKQIRGLQDEERAWVASSYGDADREAAGQTQDEAEWVSRATGTGDEADSTDTDDADSPGDATADTPGNADADADQFAAEASWVAESSLPDREGASADGSGDPVDAEAAWRDRSKPTPLTELSGIGETYAAKLAEAGVTSIRSLATADPELLADVTGLPTGKVAEWHAVASERAD